MKKFVVAGIALLLVGTAAFAAVRIGVYGVCPLTGKPLHRSKVVCPPTPECPFADERCTDSRGEASATPDVSAAPQADAAPAAECAQTRRHCYCKEQAQVERQPAQAPAAEPASRP